MNYHHQFGIRQNGGGRVIDFAPARRSDGSRRPSLFGDLDENDVDETTPLDAADAFTQTVFSLPDGTRVRHPVEDRADYNNDGETDDFGFAANLDTTDDRPRACINSDYDELHDHDDWAAISLPFRQFGNAADAPVNPADESPLEALLEIEEQVSRADLTLRVEAHGHGTPGIGDVVVLHGIVRNEGPNPSTEPEVVLTVPQGLRVISMDPECQGAQRIVCRLDELRARREATVEVRAILDMSGPLEVTGTAVDPTGIDATPADALADVTVEAGVAAPPIGTPEVFDPCGTAARSATAACCRSRHCSCCSVSAVVRKRRATDAVATPIGRS
jgi:hypothetical protein